MAAQASAETRWVFPKPNGPWKITGLKCPSAQEATRRATAWANSLEGPTTKLSKVKRSCRPPGPRPRRTGGRAVELGLGFEAGLQDQGAAFHVVGGPQLIDPHPGVAADPVTGDPGVGDETERAARRRQDNRRRQIGLEAGFTELDAQQGASLSPDKAVRRPPRLIRNHLIRHEPHPDLILPPQPRKQTPAPPRA